MAIPVGDVIVAESVGQRLRGLAGRDADELAPLFLPRCRSIHTIGMRASIDVVWLRIDHDERAQVLAVDARVAPGRLLRAPRRGRDVGALELPAGQAKRLGILPGVELELG